ncbi:GDSL-type esterase/lipase family protein [Marinivivus vitaminiproducens]|uniref:GDSL-type esterase/lipase family protein n=1 Tax=Marinivivus vitaminiproducens TaxID=3035935 RepID=UPI0027A42902|nr:GDSL-type esterase/lipase family protein [Geminicoccaceae bacterium SCSIO 64248]
MAFLLVAASGAGAAEPKRIMLYGGSNTWGWAATAEATLDRRYEEHERWSGVLRQALGPDYVVIEEGRNGRTTDIPDPLLRSYFGTPQNGAAVLPERLAAHDPVDLVVLMVGTNDLIARFDRTPFRVGLGVGTLIDIVQRHQSAARPERPAARVLVVSPPPLGDLQPEKYQRVYAGGEAKSRELAPVLAAIAHAAGAAFLDAGTVTVSDGPDGVHLTAEAHRRLGEALAPAIRTLFASRQGSAEPERPAAPGRLDAVAHPP